MALTQVPNAMLSSDLQGVTPGFKNRIINGAMVIDQRNAGASVTPVNAQFITDRWQYNCTQTNKFTAQQNQGSVTPPSGFSNYLGVTSSSSYSVTSTDYFDLLHKIEGFNTADLGWGASGASSVILSFWVRSSLTGTFGGCFSNSGLNYSYPFSYTISSANTWTQISLTISGPTAGTWVGATNGIGLWIIFGLGAGSSYTGGTSGVWAANSPNFINQPTGTVSVVGTNGATFYITGVQLEKGSTATSFDYRPYSAELAMCQRYFEKMPTGASGYASVRTTDWYGYIHWQTEKRTAPTITLTGVVDLVGSIGDITNQTPTGIDQASVKTARIYRTGSAFTSQAAFIYVTNNIAISSEL